MGQIPCAGHSLFPQIFLELLLRAGLVVNKIGKNPCSCGTDILEGETGNKQVNKNINGI